jgi:hypothetical protein
LRVLLLQEEPISSALADSSWYLLLAKEFSNTRKNMMELKNNVF